MAVPKLSNIPNTLLLIIDLNIYTDQSLSPHTLSLSRFLDSRKLILLSASNPEKKRSLAHKLPYKPPFLYSALFSALLKLAYRIIKRYEPMKTVGAQHVHLVFYTDSNPYRMWR